MLFRRTVSRPRGRVLTERGQGLAVLLTLLGVAFWVVAAAKGLV